MKLVVDDENVSGAPMQLMVIVEQMRCSETEMMAEPNCRHSGGGSQIATVELGFAVCARRAHSIIEISGFATDKKSHGTEHEYNTRLANAEGDIAMAHSHGRPAQSRTRLRAVRPRMARELRAKTRVIGM